MVACSQPTAEKQLDRFGDKQGRLPLVCRSSIYALRAASRAGTQSGCCGTRHAAPKGLGPGAIVAPVNCRLTGHVVGVWRIFPSLVGPMGDRRRGLGPKRANCSRLFPVEGDELAIGEGVESTLALHTLTGMPAWSTLTAENMALVTLPKRFRRLVLCQDIDAPDKHGRRAGPDAARALASRLRLEGRVVELVQARGGGDANDQLRRKTAQ